MSRRRLTLLILALLAVQLLGGMAMEAPCSEPCPDEAEDSSCPPVCVLCTICRHAQAAIVKDNQSGELLVMAQHFLSEPAMAAPSRLESDIFHVPLRG